MSEAEIRTLVVQSPSKSCGLDPLPNWLLKDNLDVLLPTLIQIVNSSMSSGNVSDSLKEALVTPLLKKNNLDPERHKNFQPVSNLLFISKLIERVVASRLNTYMSEHGLHEIIQSAYKKHHSTETVLLRISDNVLRARDNKKCALLVLLDMSAAFDTVDHSILLSRVDTRLGNTGTALSWFRSYLTNRKQSVLIRRVSSSCQRLDFGVPQGSVLGPILFCDYTLPLGDIMRRHDIEFHLYADDSQLLLTFNPESSQSALAAMERCIAEVRLWMA